MHKNQLVFSGRIWETLKADCLRFPWRSSDCPRLGEGLAHFTNLTRTGFFHCDSKCWYEGKKIVQSVCDGPKNDNTKAPIADPLLFG